MNQPASPAVLAYLQLGLTGKVAGAIADLHSVIGDIQFAHWCAQAYIQRMGPDVPIGPDGDALKRALWTACCVSYRRVFTSGKGHISTHQPRPRPNKNFTDALTPEQLEVHNMVLKTANQHVAHRVNEFEQVAISALLNPPPFPRAVVGIPAFMVHYVGPDATEAERFVSVCDLFLEVTEHELANVTEQCLKFLRERNIDELYAVAEAQQQPGQDPSQS